MPIRPSRSSGFPATWSGDCPGLLGSLYGEPIQHDGVGVTADEDAYATSCWRRLAQLRDLDAVDDKGQCGPDRLHDQLVWRAARSHGLRPGPRDQVDPAAPVAAP